MEKFITFFEEFWSASKPLPVVYFFFGLVFLLVSARVSGSYAGLLSAAGVFLTVSSCCLLIVRSLERQHSGAILSGQMFDGLLCGLIAGCIGGLIGYGFQIENTLQSVFIRTTIAAIYSIAIGGILGIIFMLLQPNNIKLVRSNYTVSILAAICLVATTIYISVVKMPVVDEGIRGWEIYIIFSIFTTAMLAKRALDNKYRLFLFYSRVVASLILQFFFHLSIMIIPAPLPEVGFEGNIWESTVFEGIRGNIVFAYIIISGVVLQSLIYSISNSNRPIFDIWDDCFKGALARK